MDEVKILEIVAGTWQAETTTWGRILQREDHPQAQLIFSSLRVIADAPDILRGCILNKFRIAPFLLHRVCLESNGFSGCEPILDAEGTLAHYNHWSRFVMKQTHERLHPKRSFTRHLPVSESLSKVAVPIHDLRSVSHGWEWFEMGFLVHWTPPLSTTIICFDLPQQLQTSIQSALRSNVVKFKFSDPYSLFAVILQELLPLYDGSVWSIRNHICNWEATRPKKSNYLLLHELARHAIHVSETLAVALESVKDIQHQHREFMAMHPQSSSTCQLFQSPFQFPLRLLDSLLSRSDSNKARLQNETLLAFHTAAQCDSQIQVRIGEEARKEATAMKAIAVITMTFLPATFISSVFSTPFFHFEQAQGEGGESLAVSSQFWIYWAFAAPLSLFTLLLWTFCDREWGRRETRAGGFLSP